MISQAILIAGMTPNKLKKKTALNTEELSRGDLQMIIAAFAAVFIIGIIAMVLSVVSFQLSQTKENQEEKSRFKALGKLAALVTAMSFTLTIVLPVGLPQYKVWQQNKEGEAELARAEQNRQIAIQEAKAKEESAKSLANAEIIRAQGVAEANRIIGDSLQNNDAYIHYLWIEALRESNNEVIYIPTEAGIPITESARFFKKNQLNQQLNQPNNN